MDNTIYYLGDLWFYIKNIKGMTLKIIICLLFTVVMSACSGVNIVSSSEQLVKESYVSVADNLPRNYFVYLPKGYDDNPDKEWPVLLFLHGDGERGNGLDELGFVLSHGPVYEAWIQKKELPFIIISPQLHMFGRDKIGISYLENRPKSNIERRLKDGVPNRKADFGTNDKFERIASLSQLDEVAPLIPNGWERVEDDLLAMLETVKQKYKTDQSRVYLSGLSYGGYGTWYMASKHPEKFTAIAPVVGWGHPSFMAPIAKEKLPVWQFAGGRDTAVKIQYFYAGLNELERLGHHNVRFTVHEDMGHDAWTRVYASDDFYQWLLGHQK